MKYFILVILLLSSTTHAIDINEYVIALNQQLTKSGAVVFNRADFLEISLPRKILFEFDSSNPDPMIGTLTALVEVFKAMPSRTLTISGHTDPSGSEAYNLDLASARALSVKSALVGMGLEPFRITTRVFGEMNPPSPIEGLDFNRISRRVELEIK